MVSISDSVGNKGRNLPNDVLVIQGLLNKNLKYLSPHLALKTDGYCGPVTVGMILEFQKKRVGLSTPDGCVEPNGKTIQMLTEVNNGSSGQVSGGAPFDNLLLVVQQFLLSSMTSDSEAKDEKVITALSESDYQNAASLLSVEIATIKAVSAVESKGSGFLVNGKPKILFEGHWFSKFTQGKYDKSHPTLSYPKWTKAYYVGGAAEYGRYNTAKTLDATAAMKSTSWGRFQIMGFNYDKAGYVSVEAFVADMHKAESYQLASFVKMLKATGMDAQLRAKDWATFAKNYNGPKYAENKYDVRLRQAYNAFSAKK
jgi:peptidoglycan hydrolase-like protein with peptidoglycan-binding domain